MNRITNIPDKKELKRVVIVVGGFTGALADMRKSILPKSSQIYKG